MNSISFTNCTIANFLSFKSASIDLQDRGLLLVRGVNNTSSTFASNGSGKTALAEAIFWCLYGTTLRKIAAKDVIHRGADSCAVTLRLNIDGAQVIIARVRKASSSDVSVRVNGKPLGAKESKEYLAKLLQDLPDTLFTNFVYLGRSGRFSSFLRMSDTERKEFIRSLYPVLGQLEKVNALTKSKIKELNTSLQASETAIAGDVRERNLLQKEIECYAERMQQAESEVEEWEQSIRTEYVLPYGPIEYAFKVIIDAIKNKLSATPQPTVDYQPIEQEYDDYAPYVAKEAELQASIKQINQVIRQTQAKLREGIPLECPTCHRAFEDKASRQAMLQEMENCLKENNELLQKQMTRLEKYQSALQEMKDGYAVYVAKSQEAAKQTMRIKDDLKQEISTLQQGLTRYKSHMEYLNDSLAEAARGVETKSKRLAEVTALLEKAESAGLAMKNTIRQYNAVLAMTGNSGLPSVLMDTLLAVIEKHANRLIKRLSGSELTITLTTAKTGAYREQDGNISVVVQNANGSASYEGNSSGEQTRADICILFGIILALKELHGLHIPLLFVDEILDSIDDAGCEMVIELLEEEILPAKENIFVISHNDTLKSKFEKTITIKKEKGCSVILS